MRHRPGPQSPTTPSGTRRGARRAGSATLALVAFAALAIVGPGRASAAVTPPAGLTMEATVLLGGHVRVGSWMAIDVHLKNDGPAIGGELRMAGGTQGRTRFGTAVDVPTQSDKTYRMYAQPPGFGRELEISLVDGDTTVATTKAAFTLHDGAQMVVGIVAERPGDIIADLDLLPNVNNVKPLTLGLSVADLPDRVEAWGALDRLIWQDTDSSSLDAHQAAALRGWVAGGGRLVIVGGTSGPSSLSAFPDTLLPYHPTSTVDVAPSSLVSLLGDTPSATADVPALAGLLVEGRAMARVGEQVVAAERPYGSGLVTIVGFDPTATWLKGTSLAEGLWRRVIPTRSSGGPVVGDDSQIVQAASQLPSLALPPVGGLVALLGGYILLIGPVNYLVLRRLDKREWAWVTMPALIVAFAVGAYVFGTLLRGSDLIINEVAIVRGAPGATEGLAQAYLGVFSPTRGTYQLRVPGGALLSSPTSGDFFGSNGQTTAALDVLQGDPSRVRDLGVGFGSLRTIRAETAVAVPLVRAELRLEDGRLRGTVTNASNETLLAPAVVLGGTVARLQDLAPGGTGSVDAAIQPAQMGQQLSDKVVGPVSFGDPRQVGEDAARKYARHTMIDQLTFDPNFGFTGTLPADGAVVMAWADRDLLPVEIEGASPRRTGNVLWFLPSDITVKGKTTFRQDLIRNTVISTDAAFFNKDPFNMNFGRGKADLSFRPIAFQGSIDPTQLTIALNFGDITLGIEPKPVSPLATVPPTCGNPPAAGCVQPILDGLPEVELYDLDGAVWRRLPHLTGGTRYGINEPRRYIDRSTGTVLVRFVNDNADGVGFSLDLSITGIVE